MTYYERRLPHWHPEGRLLFVTWRLFGSLPKRWEADCQSLSTLNPGERFRIMDQYLDRRRNGPLWLRNPHIAECVLTEMARGQMELKQYTLHAFVIMPNHVHVLLQPVTALSAITHRIKGVTSRRANKILSRTGHSFWQDESFDHWVRNEKEYLRVSSYIERNPVKARLVKRPEDWFWSSAHPAWHKVVGRQ